MKLIETFAGRFLKSRPAVNITLCIGCGDCKTDCPTKALGLFPFIPKVELRPKTGEPRPRAEINYSKCTRCYRCRELCTRKAITERRPLLVKLFRL